MSNFPVLKLKKVPTSADTTVYEQAGSNGAIERLLANLGKQQISEEYSVDRFVQLQSGNGQPIPARIVACRCFQGTKWSVTIRKDGEKSGRYRQKHYTSNYQPSTKISPKYFTSLEVICNSLYKSIYSGRQRSGLVVVTGATASGKSEVTRGLIFRKMEAAIESARECKTRHPHLITMEDPIEKFYIDEQSQPSNFNYTPREKKVDVPNLKAGFKDALRQTPTLVFVGEIRDDREWRDVISFASTGHSVIATAHAGSLAETWGKILAAVDARTAQERSDIADRVLAARGRSEFLA